MEKHQQRKRRFWGYAIPLAVIAGTSFAYHREQLLDAGLKAWSGFVFLVIVAGMVFVALRILRQSLLGFIAAMLLIAHPVVEQSLAQPGPALQAEALKLSTFGLMIVIWQIAWRPRSQVWKLVVGGVGLVVLSALAWQTELGTGQMVALFSTIGMIGGAILVAVCRQRQELPPSAANLVLLTLMGLLIALGGVAGAWGLAHVLMWLGGMGISAGEVLALGAMPDGSSLQQIVYAIMEQSILALPSAGTHLILQATWPNAFFVLALAALGLWRAFFRGLSENRSGQAPIAWLLLALGVALGVIVFIDVDSLEISAGLPLTTLAFLAAGFGMGDSIRWFGEQMILEPPDDPPAVRMVPLNRVAAIEEQESDRT